MQRTKTKYTGVYYQTLANKDKVYYITYKDITTNKKVWLKIGKFSEGIRELYCSQKRNEVVNKNRLGEEPPAAIKNKQRKKILIGDIADKYFQERKEGRSKNIDVQSFNKHLLTYFDDLEMVTKSDIVILKKSLKMKKNNVGNCLSDKTVNNILSLLIAVIRYGIKEELLKNDITKYISKFSIDNSRERFLTSVEVKELYNNLSCDDNLYFLTKLALNTGARLNTLLNIKKQDIDFTYNIITLKDFKNNTTYKSFIPTGLSQELNSFTSVLKGQDKLFPKNPEKRLRAILNELFNKDVDSSDRKNKVVIHTLRHTFASHLAINGTPIFTIQKLMNHKDIKMTMRYAKLAPDSGKEAITNLMF